MNDECGWINLITLTDLKTIKTDGNGFSAAATKEAPAKSDCSASQQICPCDIKTSAQVFCFVFLRILQLQNEYVKSAQWRDAMTFSWMLYTKSKRPTICWVPAWRHLIPIPLMRHYRWNASRHHNPPKLALGLSDFSFHFNVFKKIHVSQQVVKCRLLLDIMIFAIRLT